MKLCFRSVRRERGSKKVGKHSFGVSQTSPAVVCVPIARPDTEGKQQRKKQNKVRPGNRGVKEGGKKIKNHILKMLKVRRIIAHLKKTAT